MKKILAFVLTLCLLGCSFIGVSAAEITESNPAGKTVFTATVPGVHKITASVKSAEVFVNGKPGTEFSVDRLSEPKILIRPGSGYKIAKVLMNGEDVTDKLSGGYLSIGKVFEDKTLTVEAEKAALPETSVKFTVKGTVTLNGDPFEGAAIELRSTLKNSVTDKDGKFTFSDVETGKHSLTVLKDGQAVGYVEFEIQSGDETAFILLEDGSYLVTVPADTESVEFEFNITDDGKVEIKTVSVSEKQPGGDPPQTGGGSTQPGDIPQTGDDGNIALWIALLFVSGMGAAGITAYSKKKRTNKTN